MGFCTSYILIAPRDGQGEAQETDPRAPKRSERVAKIVIHSAHGEGDDRLLGAPIEHPGYGDLLWIGDSKNLDVAAIGDALRAMPWDRKPQLFVKSDDMTYFKEVALWPRTQ